MLDKRILIVSEPYDPHVDAMILNLRQRGENPFRLHTEDLLDQGGFDLRFNGERAYGQIWNGKETLPMEAIKSTWWRRPKPPRIDKQFSRNEIRYIRSETEHAVSGFWATLNCYWMSHPARLREARWKPAQLQRALALGFKIPRSIISRDPDEVIEFIDSCGGCAIFKVLSDPTLGRTFASPGTIDQLKTNDEKAKYLAQFEHQGPATMVYCTKVTKEMVAENSSLIRNSPCLFQELIEKRFEYRVTVIGKQVFTARIDSQAQQETALDWRNYDVPMLFSKGGLPEAVEQRCFEFMKSYGLNYSAIDLIEDKDGNYIFLECNANGQWLFVEMLVPELKLMDAMSNCLIQGTQN